MKISYLISIVLVVLATEANAQTAPRSEFTIHLDTNLKEVKPGGASELTVTILRSKPYSRTIARLGLSSQLPEGISVNFDPAEGIIQSSTATITVAENVKPGNYQIILNAELNRKIKGTVLKLKVTDSEVVTIK